MITSPSWLLIFSLLLVKANGPTNPADRPLHIHQSDQKIDMTIFLTINNKRFSATLQDNPTAKALVQMLPLTLSMEELNGNEKFFFLPSNLPAQEASIGQIESGDIMLYGKNCIVIFYVPFKTSYRYTRLGKIDNPAGLAAALGTGTAKVQWSQ